MTRDDIIRLAKEAEFNSFAELWAPALERFATLVAAHEREACAKVCKELVLEHPGRADLTAQQCAAAIRARGER